MYRFCALLLVSSVAADAYRKESAPSTDYTAGTMEQLPSSSIGTGGSAYGVAQPAAQNNDYQAVSQTRQQQPQLPYPMMPNAFPVPPFIVSPMSMPSPMSYNGVNTLGSPYQLYQKPQQGPMFLMMPSQFQPQNFYPQPHTNLNQGPNPAGGYRNSGIHSNLPAASAPYGAPISYNGYPSAGTGTTLPTGIPAGVEQSNDSWAAMDMRRPAQRAVKAKV